MEDSLHAPNGNSLLCMFCSTNTGFYCFKCQGGLMLCALFRAIPMELKGNCTELKDSMWASPKSYRRAAYFDGGCT